jgi:glycosyltransferase involved in cell wall biosynthesis
MRVSFIISTHNRRDVLLHTIEHLAALGLSDFDVHVVDNASSDGTAQAVAKLGWVRLHAQESNRGSCAKNVGIPHARGEIIVFLDDDSYPEPGSIQRMIRYFQDRPRLGAATFAVTLPDGSRECSAYPNVFIGCGVGLRRSAIEEVGGLPEDFFMQAEEYDLSLRLLEAGWQVERFDDLNVTHLKTPVARTPDRVMGLDVRNNLMLIGTYFPDEWALPFCVDWLRRYWLIASTKRQRRAFLLGMLQGAIGVMRRERMPVSAKTFEQFGRIEEIREQMLSMQRDHQAHSVLFIDLGKNTLPYWLAAKASGLLVVAVADNRLAGKRYRGVRIVSDEDARRMAFDVAVASNSSPVHAQARTAQWRSLDRRPILDLLKPTRANSISVAA